MVAAQDDEELSDDDVQIFEKSIEVKHIPVPATIPERLSKSLLNQGRNIPPSSPAKPADKDAKPAEKDGDFEATQVNVSVGDEDEDDDKDTDLKMAEEPENDADTSVDIAADSTTEIEPVQKDKKTDIEDKVESFMAEIEHVFGAPDLNSPKSPVSGEIGEITSSTPTPTKTQVVTCSNVMPPSGKKRKRDSSSSSDSESDSSTGSSSSSGSSTYAKKKRRRKQSSSTESDKLKKFVKKWSLKSSSSSSSSSSSGSSSGGSSGSSSGSSSDSD
jgi:hypothetical protein